MLSQLSLTTIPNVFVAKPADACMVEMAMLGTVIVSVWVAVTWPVLSVARIPFTPVYPALGMVPETGVAVAVLTDQFPDPSVVAV